MNEICWEDLMLSVISQKRLLVDLYIGLRKHFHFRGCLYMPYILGNDHAFPSSKYYGSS